MLLFSNADNKIRFRSTEMPEYGGRGAIQRDKSASAISKGQIISECPYEIIVWTKIPMKKYPRFLP